MRRAAFGLFLFLSLGCKQGAPEPDPAPAATAPPAPSTSQPDPTTKASSDVLPLLAKLGDGAPVAVVARLDRWPEIRSAAEALVGSAELPEVESLLAAKDPAALLAWVESERGLDGSKLRGIDFTRPLVASFGEPADLEPFALPEMKDEAGQFRSLGVRHVVFVPVDDAKEFLASLPAALGAELVTVPTWGATEDSWTARSGESDYVVAEPEGDYARVTWLQGVFGVSPDEAKARLSTRLRPTASPPADTPALRAVVADDAAVAMHLRPWRFRAFFSDSGRTSVLRALSAVEPEMRATLMAKGISIVLLSEMLMSDAGAEIDDWGWTLRAADGQLGIGGVGSLTPTGRKVFDAAKTEVAPLPVKDPRVAAEGFVRMDLQKAFEAVGLPTSLTTLRSGSLAQRFAECGPGCSIHAATRSPLRALQLAVTEIVGPIPSGLQVHALQGALVRPKPPAGSVAFVLGGSSAQAFETLVDAATGGRGPTWSSTPRGDEVVLQYAEGADTVFEFSERATDAIAAGSIGSELLEELGFPVRDLRAALVLRHDGPALVAELAVRRGADPTLAYAPEVKATTWSSPILSYPGADTSDCTVELAAALSRTFGALATAAPDQRATMLNKGIDEIDPATACKGNELANRRAQELAKFMELLLAEPERDVPTSTTDLPLPMGGVRVVVEPKRLLLEGKEISAEAEDHFNEELRDALEIKAETLRERSERRGEEFDGRIRLEIPPTMTFTRAMDVLWSAHQSGFPNFDFIVEGSDGPATIYAVGPATWDGRTPRTDIPEVELDTTGLEATAPGGKAMQLKFDFKKLQAWAKKNTGAGPTVRVRIGRGVDMQTVINTLDALRGSDCKLGEPVMSGKDAKACLLFGPIVDVIPRVVE